MAPEANIVSVQVLDKNGSGSLASVMAGMDKVKEMMPKYKLMVANMSLGANGAKDPETDPMVAKVREGEKAGIPYVIAAGNSGTQGIATPGTTPEATTVAALNIETKLVESFSSKEVPGKPGKLDVAASGKDVLAPLPDDKYGKASGTSMAAPHTEGADVLLMSGANMLSQAGKLKEGVTVLSIDYDALINESAEDDPKQPSSDEGFGMMRVDKAWELLVQRYTKATVDEAYAITRQLGGVSA
jgi:subtilisin family serine protease